MYASTATADMAYQVQLREQFLLDLLIQWKARVTGIPRAYDKDDDDWGATFEQVLSRRAVNYQGHWNVNGEDARESRPDQEMPEDVEEDIEEEDEGYYAGIEHDADLMDRMQDYEHQASFEEERDDLIDLVVPVDMEEDSSTVWRTPKRVKRGREGSVDMSGS